jgi:hypothetical protein
MNLYNMLASCKQATQEKNSEAIIKKIVGSVKK